MELNETARRARRIVIDTKFHMHIQYSYIVQWRRHTIQLQSLMAPAAIRANEASYNVPDTVVRAITLMLKAFNLILFCVCSILFGENE